MDNKSEHDALIRALGEFSLPFETLEEAKTASIKLDALVSVLLKTAFAERRVGPERLKALSSGRVEAPAVLRAVGGEPFERAAQFAEVLLDITRASVLDIEGDDIILAEANARRGAFSQAFQGLLPLIVGQRIERDS
jgi:hypothetical protein